MTIAPSVKPERRQRTYQLITELHNERREVWALYCQIAELKPFASIEAVSSKLTEFSQLLVDYVSLGHFGVYERMLAGTERRDLVLSTAKDLYPEFSATTDAAIAFNDKYEKLEEISLFDELERDLSQLGEALAKRNELEDRLCEVMRR